MSERKNVHFADEVGKPLADYKSHSYSQSYTPSYGSHDVQFATGNSQPPYYQDSYTPIDEVIKDDAILEDGELSPPKEESTNWILYVLIILALLAIAFIYYKYRQRKVEN